MLSKATTWATTCALALSLFSLYITAAPFPSEEMDLEARSADTTSSAGGLWASSTIIIKRDADANAEANADVDTDTENPKLHHRTVTQADISSINQGGVTANCQWRWLDGATLDQAHCTVGDTGCDSHEVYASLQISGAKGWKEIGKVKNDHGCHEGPVRDPTAHTYRDAWGGLFKARVVGCVDDNGIKDSCYYGNFVYNPN